MTFDFQKLKATLKSISDHTRNQSAMKFAKIELLRTSQDTDEQSRRACFESAMRMKSLCDSCELLSIWSEKAASGSATARSMPICVGLVSELREALTSYLPNIGTASISAEAKNLLALLDDLVKAIQTKYPAEDCQKISEQPVSGVARKPVPPDETITAILVRDGQTVSGKKKSAVTPEAAFRELIDQSHKRLQLLGSQSLKNFNDSVNRAASRRA